MRSLNQPHAKLTPRRVLHLTLCLMMAAVILLTCTQCKGSESKDSETEPKDTPATESQTGANIDPLKFVPIDVPDDGTNGFISDVDPGVYIYHNMTFELCGASDDAGKDYASAISEVKAALPNVTVYNMVAPTHTEYGIPARLTGELYTASQAQNIKTIYSSYSQDVKPINCYNTLWEHKDEYIYFNTDHHWTGLGAYYAYEAFCQQTGQEALKLTDCTENKIEGFEGSFSDCAESLQQNLDTVYYWTFPYKTHAQRQDNPGEELYDTTIYYEGIGAGSSTYSTFICGDSPLFIEYNDDNKNGRKIAVVKESYGNAFVPYLSYNYEEVHVIDSRYFEDDLKEYLEKNGITELIFVNNIMSANNPYQTDGIREMV